MLRRHRQPAEPIVMLEARDYRGRRVILTLDIWINKILATRPSAIKYFPEQIRLALTDPTEVRVDRTHTDRRCHYLDIGHNTRGEQGFLKVVIFYEDDASPSSEGKVLTCYPTGCMPSGEQQEWP